MEYIQRLILLTGISSILGFFCGCTSARANGGDAIVSQLRIGMTKEHVTKALGIDRRVNKFRIPNDLYTFLGEVVPYDLPSHIPDETEMWTYGYWVNSNTKNTVDVFFGKDGRVIGWAKQHSKQSWDKYQHERLTSQLKKGMSEEKVKILLGSPHTIISLPNQESREIYSDHFWIKDPVTPGLKDWPMWVYTYPLAGGKVRRVHLFFGSRHQLEGWGYDHAHEEAERYLREQGAKR